MPGTCNVPAPCRVKLGDTAECNSALLLRPGSSATSGLNPNSEIGMGSIRLRRVFFGVAPKNRSTHYFPFWLGGVRGDEGFGGMPPPHAGGVCSRFPLRSLHSYLHIRMG